MDDRRELDKRRFHFDTTVNIAHILTTLAAIGAVLSWGHDIKATVMRHDAEIADIKTNAKEDRAFIREELREINRKMDKISERIK